MVISAIKNRYSVRNYKNIPVEKEKIEAILEAGRISPSAKNIQNWKFVLIQDNKTKEDLVEVSKNQTFIKEASFVIAVCVGNLDYIMTCGFPAHFADAMIASQNMITQATSMNIGSCYIGAFYQDKAAKLLNLPQDWKVAMMITFGYADTLKKARPTKSMEEILLKEKFD